MSGQSDANSSRLRPTDSNQRLRSQRQFLASLQNNPSAAINPPVPATTSDTVLPTQDSSSGYNTTWSYPSASSSLSTRSKPRQSQSSHPHPPHPPQQHTPNQTTSAVTAQPAHTQLNPQPHSMFAPSIMFPDEHPDPRIQEAADGYDRWAQTFAQQHPSHFDFGRTNTTTTHPTNLAPNPFNSQTHAPHLQPHHPGTAPTGILDITSPGMQNPAQNQYSFALQGHYMPSMDAQENVSYGQQPYAPQQHQHLPIAQRLSRQVQQQPSHTQPAMTVTSRTDYAASQHPPPIPSAPMVYGEYQQQHQNAYGHPTQRPQHPDVSQTEPQHYVQNVTPESGIEISGQGVPQQQHAPPPQGQFTFWYPTAQSDIPSGPNSVYAPSPDPAMTIPPSSVSPSSRGGTDDGRSRSLHSGNSVSPQPLPSSSHHSNHNVASTSAASMPTVSTFRRFQAQGTAAPKRGRGRPSKKRKKIDPDVESDSGSEEDEPTLQELPAGSSAVPPLRGPNGTFARLPGACTHCKKLKMKCEFPRDENTCKRCKTSGHHCVVEGRKLRTAPNKREYLLAQIRQKDAIIESLLKQLHNPYLATPLSIDSYRMATSPSDKNNRNVLQWLERMQESVRTAGSSAGPKAFEFSSRRGPAAHGQQEGVDEDSDGESDNTSDPTRGPGSTIHGSAVGGMGEGGRGIEELRGEDEKLHALPDSAVPLGLIANLSLSSHRHKRSGGKVGGGGAGGGGGEGDDQEVEDDDNVGVANKTYFQPGPAFDLIARESIIKRHSPPEILVHGLVTPEDVEKLFEIFYARLNTHVSLLDPVIHTPSSTFARCPFLFTVICAISSRYYADKSEIYPIAMHFAKHAAANALVTGWKSVELAQAYILMSIYSVPARRWEDDRSWLYAGLAIRLSTDLNLHQPSSVKPTSEAQEREMLNRTRTWMICYNQDRSTATQYGKPSTIKEDFIMRQSADWYKKSKFNNHYDIGMCAYNCLLRVVARFHDEIFSDPDSPSGLNESLDFLVVTTRHDENLSRFFTEWTGRFEGDSDRTDPGSAFRNSLLPFLTSYSRLVMYSFGFQQAYRRGMRRASDRVFLDKCYQSAEAVINCMVNDLAPSGYMRYSPDGHFIFATFASAFLLKLLKPEFSGLITKDQEGEIFDLIGRLIQTLNSPEIAIDDRHTPRLHARFLSGLLSKHRRDVSRTERTHSQQPPQTGLPLGSSGTYPGQPPSGTSSSGQVYPVQPPQGGSNEQQGMGQSRASPESVVPTEATATVTYDPEPVYATTTEAPAPVVEVGGYVAGPSKGDFDVEMGGLGVLQVLKTPAYWQTMMMPGFDWPDSRGSPVYHHQGIPGITSGFSTLQAGIQYS